LKTVERWLYRVSWVNLESIEAGGCPPAIN
jgi:hypothetical protein